MGAQVQKQKPKAEQKPEADTEQPHRSDEAEKLLKDTDDLLDEIDELVKQGELVDATLYVQLGGE